MHYQCIIIEHLVVFMRHIVLFSAVSVFRGLEAISGPPLRSVMSKAVSIEDQGAVYNCMNTHLSGNPNSYSYLSETRIHV